MGVVGEACASCELVLEGVVGEASELWNKDPVVMPLTWDMVSVLQHFHWYCWAAAGDYHPPVLTLGAGSACVLFHLAGSCSNGGAIEIYTTTTGSACLSEVPCDLNYSHKVTWDVDMPALCGCHPSKAVCLSGR